MPFDGKTYKQGKQLFMRKQESKDETDLFIKVETNIMFTQMYAKAGIKKIGEKSVAAMVKHFRKIDKGLMEGKPVVTSIDQDTLYFKDKRKALESVNLIKKKRREK